MDDDIIVTLKRSNDLLMTFGNDYSDVFLPAIDEIERLRKAMDVQANAVNVLHQAETSELNHLRKTAQEAYMAKMTLDSEREANRILTDEIEQLREVLRFYAEWGIDAPAVDAIIEEDCGDKAREALKEKE